MSFLALEFSTNRRSVTVLKAEAESEATVEAAASTARPDEGPGPFALINQALAEAGVDRRDIRTVVVGLGPGSYTGIRMAISIAIGWATALPVQLLGVPSIDAVASAFLRNQLEGSTGSLGCAAALDAQQKQFYLRRYPALDAWPDQLPEIEIADGSAIQQLAAEGLAIVGPDADKLPPGSVGLSPSATELLRLADNPARIIQRGALTPLYIRPTRFVKAGARL